MSATVDERIVAAKFDAKDFEKGVDKTIKKLDELKKSLDFKEATKSVKELAEKTEVSTDSMSKSLDKLTDRFTKFTGMIKQKILSGLADEVANVFLRMEQSVKNFTKSISVDQINQGLDKYQQMLTSVRVMVSNGVGEKQAYGALDQLTEYVDQTSYSLTQMTDALSKMVSAGLKGEDGLETATKAVQGIANACANAGINAQDAQRAFYNLSQAYGKGKLEYTDYKSLELMNMTTASFKENLMKAAEEVGTLKKVSEGIYQTTNKVDKKVKSGKKVTSENLTDMLRYDFVNTDVMNKLFGSMYYFSEKELDKIYEEMGISKYDASDAQREQAYKKAKEQYGELAVQAYLAAREARSFTDVVNALRDAVSTGWAKTFEHLFGQLEQAKDFFTQLSEGALAETIYMIGDWRNAVLESWNAMDARGNLSGGEAFRQSILNITDAIGILLRALGVVDVETEDGEAMAKAAGERLFEITVQIRNFTTKIKLAAKDFKSWMEEIIDGESRIDRFRRIISNLSSAFGIIGKVVVIAFDGFVKLFNTLSPIFDGISKFLEKVTQPLVDLKNNEKVYNDLANSVENFSEALSKVTPILGDILSFLGDIGAFVAQFAIDTLTSNIEFFSDILGIFMEIFTGSSAQKKMNDGKGILDGIREDFEGIKNACSEGIGALKGFFGAIISDVRTLLGLTDAEDASKSGVFSNLINFFDTNEFVQKAKVWVNQAIIDVGDFIKSIPLRVKKFGENIYTTLRGLFFEDKTVYTGKGNWETKTVLNPLGEWLDCVIKSIKDFIISIPDKIIAGIGKVGNWIDDIFNSLFGTEAIKESTKNGSVKSSSADKEVTSEFDIFLGNFTGSIKEWFDDLPNKIRTGLKSAGGFFTRVYNVINDFLFGKKVTKKVKEVGVNGKVSFKTISTRYKTGFSAWLDTVIKDVKKFIAKIPEYIKAGIKGAGDIITTIINTIFGTSNDKEVTSDDIQKRLEKPFTGININRILDTIKDIGKTLLNQIARIFTGSEDIEANQEWFSNKVSEGIEWIRQKAEIALKWVLEFIGDIPSKISGIFSSDNGGSDQSTSPVKTAIVNFGTTVGNFLLYDLPTAILTFVDNAITEIDKIWDRIYKAIIGGAEGSEEKASEEVEKVKYPDAMKGHHTHTAKSKWETFVEQLGKTISNAFSKLPQWIAEGINAALTGMQGLFGKVTGWLKSENAANEMAKAAEEAKKQVEQGTTNIAESVSEGTKQAADNVKKDTNNEEQSPLLQAILGIGQSVYNLITVTVPEFISEAWKWLGTKVELVWNGLADVFSGDPQPAEKNNVINNVIATIKDIITNWIPKKIKEIWDLGVDIYKGITSVFSGEIPTGDRQAAIRNVVLNIKGVIEDAFKSISELFSNKNAYKKNIVGSGDMYKNVVTEVEKQQQQANTRLEQNAGQSGFWTFVDGIKNGILSALSSVGPTVLNGLSTALEWIGKIATYLMDELTGKKSIANQLTDAYGEEKPELKQALMNIGNSIKKFFLETIPTLMGSAFGTLAKEAPKWFATFFGAMNDAANKEGENAFSGGGATYNIDGAMSTMDVVKNIFNQLKEWVGENKDFLEIMGVLLVLSMLFSRLSDLFSVADEIEAGKNAIKWTAITLAVVAVSGILSYIKEVVNSGDTEKIKQFEEIIDKIGNMLLALTGVLGMVSLGKIADALGNKWEGGKQKLSVGEKLLGGLTDSISGFFGALGIGAATSITGGMVSATITSMMEDISGAFADLASGIEDALQMLTPFIDDLVTLDDKLDKAKSAVTKLADLFSEFYKAFGDLYNEATGASIEREAGTNIYVAGKGENAKIGTFKLPTGMDAFLETLMQRIDLFNSLAVFIDRISLAIGKFDNIPNIEEKLSNMNEVFSSADFSGFMTNLLNILKTSFDESNLSAKKLGVTEYMVGKYNSGISIALETLANSLSIFRTGISDISVEDVNNFDATLKVFESLAAALEKNEVTQGWLSKWVNGDKTLSAAGNEIKQFGLQMQTFFGYIKDIKGFGDNDYEETFKKLDGIVYITKAMAKAMEYMLTYGSSESYIQALTEKFPSLGEAVAKFFNYINDALYPKDSESNFSQERADALYKAVLSASAMIEAITDMATVFGRESNNSLASITEDIFEGFHMDGTTAAKIASSLRVFDEAILRAMNEPDFLEGYSDIGKSIAQKLFEGIQAAFEEDPSMKLQITPVLNLDTAKQQLVDFFGTGSIDGFNLSSIVRSALGANTNTEQNQLDYTAKFDEVVGAIDALKNSQVAVGDIADAFSGMQIVTDTGRLIAALTPGIDEAIGRRIWLIQRNRTV